MSKQYVGDVGTVITVEIGSDISGASALELRVKKPSGAVATWVGTLVGTTQIQYTILAGDFNEEGVYRIQAHITSPTWTGLGDTAKFTIYPTYA